MKTFVIKGILSRIAVVASSCKIILNFFGQNPSLKKLIAYFCLNMNNNLLHLHYDYNDAVYKANYLETYNELANLMLYSKIK